MELKEGQIIVTYDKWAGEETYSLIIKKREDHRFFVEILGGPPGLVGQTKYAIGPENVKRIVSD